MNNDSAGASQHPAAVNHNWQQLIGSSEQVISCRVMHLAEGVESSLHVTE